VGFQPQILVFHLPRGLGLSALVRAAARLRLLLLLRPVRAVPPVSRGCAAVAPGSWVAMEIKRVGDHGWGRYVYIYIYVYIYVFIYVYMYIYSTLSNLYMAPPKKWVLEDDFSYLLWSFLGSMLNFGGVPAS
jgi:hypothetical protein